MDIPPGAWDLAPLIPVVAILVFGSLLVLRSPLGQALAERLRGTARPGVDDVHFLSDTRLEVESLQRRVTELEERLDFAERLLARGRTQNEEPPIPTPV
ncbi:MAG TPA: hypothetical protein VH879_16490 [Gemmatimonadales bacterium]|jgi:hypothetical protein